MVHTQKQPKQTQQRHVQCTNLHHMPENQKHHDLRRRVQNRRHIHERRTRMYRPRHTH